MEMTPAEDGPSELGGEKRTMRQRLGRLIMRAGIAITGFGRRVRGRISPFPATRIDIQFRKLTKLEYFNLFRAYRIREHDILNHRLTWSLTIQGFLFVTYGYCVQKLAELQTGENSANEFLVSYNYAVDQLKLMIIYVIPLVGIVLSIVLCFAVVTNYRVLFRLEREWNEKIKRPEPYVPNPSGAGISWAHLAVIPPLFITLILLASWLLLLITGFHMKKAASAIV
jgi:hypothetical protein